MRKNTKEAFRWIIGIIKENNIPFLISGGFAAKLYGANRPLYDIDIEVPDKYFNKLLLLVKNKVIYGPKRYLDETFDILLMTLKYQGQEIDISGCETDKLYNHETKQWEPGEIKIDNFTEKNIYGLKVPVIKKQDLLTYKSKTKRSVDLEDIKDISNLKQ